MVMTGAREQPGTMTTAARSMTKGFRMALECGPTSAAVADRDWLSILCGPHPADKRSGGSPDRCCLASRSKSSGIMLNHLPKCCVVRIVQKRRKFNAKLRLENDHEVDALYLARSTPPEHLGERRLGPKLH